MSKRLSLRLIKRTAERFRELLFDSLAEFGFWLYAYAAEHGGEVDLWIRFNDDAQLDLKYSVAALEADGWTVTIDNFDKEDLPYVP